MCEVGVAGYDGPLELDGQFGEIIVLHAWMTGFCYGGDIVTGLTKTPYDLEGNVLVYDESGGQDVSLRFSHRVGWGPSVES